jgi:acetyltransferase-like isoleucine patch superfamily enzyme
MFSKITSILKNDGFLGLCEALLSRLRKAVFTLYYRFRFKYVGRGTVFEGPVRINGGNYICLGNDVVVEAGAEFISTNGGRIDIGDSCLIERGARVQSAGEGKPELRVGRGVKIGESAFISSSGSVIIGDKVWISRGCMLGGNDVVIEDRTVFGFHVNMIGRYHGLDTETKGISFQAETRKGRIRIGENAWICTGATVLKDVNVEKFSVIAAGSVVTTDVPAYSLVAGVPAVKKRNLS